MKKIVLSAFVLVLLSTAVVVRFIRPVVAEGTIYIRADGSIEGTTDISTVDNVTYTFTGNLYGEIVVERDNIVVDGVGYILQGAGGGIGINMTWGSNVTIKNMEIKEFYYGIWLNMSSGNSIHGNIIKANNGDGIWLEKSSNNNIFGNNITNHLKGIWLEGSSNNRISGNNITTNTYHGIGLFSSLNNTLSGNNIAVHNAEGIWLYDSSGNSISGNKITNNDYGIQLYDSSNNSIYHNNFLHNTNQTYIQSSVNAWDDGYPSGGNYWSDYEDRYPNATEVDDSGIWDTPYVIDDNNQDNYPLRGMFSGFPVSWEEETYHVTTVCNSSISAFEFDQVNNMIRFNVTGEEGIGFCRVCIPYYLMAPPYTVIIDNGQTPVLYFNDNLDDNGTHRWIYFTYLHSTHKVEIIPEFPTWTSMLLLLIVLTVAIAIYKRKLLKTPIH